MATRPAATLRTIVAAAVVVGLFACGDDTGAERDSTGPVRVFAAASLTDVFNEIETAFERLHPDTDVRLQVAGSSTLREQILEGAAADVFASANEATMNALVLNGTVEETPRVFAHNRLTIAVPADNPGRVKGLADLADPDLLIGLCAEGVPCGDLARETLAAAGVEPSIDTNERDVRTLLGKIAADELDAGLVYVTDVGIGDDDVAAIPIPADIGLEVRYPIAVLAEAPSPIGADTFVAFVVGPEGQEILVAHGFGEP